MSGGHLDMRPQGARLPFRRPHPNHSEVGRQSTFSAPLLGRRHKWAQCRHFRRGAQLAGATSWPAGARASSAPSEPIGALERKWGHTIGAQLGRVLFSFYFISRVFGLSVVARLQALVWRRSECVRREWARVGALSQLRAGRQLASRELAYFAAVCAYSWHCFGLSLDCRRLHTASRTLQAAHCELHTNADGLWPPMGADGAPPVRGPFPPPDGQRPPLTIDSKGADIRGACKRRPKLRI